MRPLSFLLLLTVLAGCNAGSTMVEEEVARSYRTSIVREATSHVEADLIAQAEAVYPPRDSVLAHVPPERHDRIPETGYWYLDSFDGVRIPYALTGDAVTYYSDLIDALEAGEQLPFLTEASLEYRATASFRETYTFDGQDPLTLEALPSVSFERVHVVEMSLAWYQYCGPVCAMWINHSRIVVFDEAGTLLQVFLDGPRPIAVS
ncbi:MAG: hypothetical protein AAGI71_15080 [Bacteroidota bacterium]